LDHILDAADDQSAGIRYGHVIKVRTTSRMHPASHAPRLACTPPRLSASKPWPTPPGHRWPRPVIG